MPEKINQNVKGGGIILPVVFFVVACCLCSNYFEGAMLAMRPLVSRDPLFVATTL